MKLVRQPDGCLGLTEKWAVTRWALCIGAVLIPAAVVVSQVVSGAFGIVGLLGASAGAVGMLGVAAAISDLRVRFDMSQRIMYWEQQNWFRKHHIGVPFADIIDVYVSSTTSRSDDTTVGGYSVTHKLMVKTRNAALPLTMSEGSDKLAYEALRKDVLVLLAPHGIAPPPSTPIERLVAEGRLVDATTALRAERGVDLATARAMIDAIRRRIDASQANGGSAVGH